MTGPAPELERLIIRAISRIERWLDNRWGKCAAPFYASVDLRNSGFKIAPVDINRFPAGFNNLNSKNAERYLAGIMSRIEKMRLGASSVLLVPENHTRNMAYMENVVALQEMLRRMGIQLRVGSLDPELTAATEIKSANGMLRPEPIRRSGTRLSVDGFDPCFVLLNNDLSAGVPDILRGSSSRCSRRCTRGGQRDASRSTLPNSRTSQRKLLVQSALIHGWLARICLRSRRNKARAF
jgi:glutamate--cysteine ligase